jgi:hypothetical protein
MTEIKGNPHQKYEKCDGRLVEKSWAPTKTGVLVCEKCGGEEYLVQK